MQLTLGPARRRAERSPAIIVALMTVVFITTFAGLTATARGATQPARHGASVRTADAPAPRKAVIVAGPVGSDTAKYIAKAEKIAKAAENHGMQVVRIYSPHATWQRVVDAANGADLFVYIGHGNGWPSPHANNPVVTMAGGLRMPEFVGLRDYDCWWRRRCRVPDPADCGTGFREGPRFGRDTRSGAPGP